MILLIGLLITIFNISIYIIDIQFYYYMSYFNDIISLHFIFISNISMILLIFNFIFIFNISKILLILSLLLYKIF